MLEPQSILAWIIIGAVAGWLAGLIVKGYGFGIVGNIIVGILGAAIAGFLASYLHLYTESTIGNIVAATVGRSSCFSSLVSFAEPETVTY
jgi:uncharacterized membrane protein YeaQ/YmgE (transglycosylase-associated protein family)